MISTHQEKYWFLVFDENGVGVYLKECHILEQDDSVYEVKQSNSITEVFWWKWGWLEAYEGEKERFEKLKEIFMRALQDIERSSET